MGVTRQQLRRLAWMVGGLGMGVSVGQYGYISHAKDLSEQQIAEMQKSSKLCMMNSVGLCLLARRKKTLLIGAPFVALAVSIDLLLTSVYFERHY